jgi:DNA adenine methylase
MTSYHGGKQRIGKKIAQVIYNESTNIKEEEGFKIKGYCEPFCGMLGVYQHIPELFSSVNDPSRERDSILKYKAGDKNKSLIMMWKEAQKGWIPPTYITKKEYETLKYQKKSTSVKGFIGHVSSFRGIYFGTWDYRLPKTIIKNNSHKVSKIATTLVKDVEFIPGSYRMYTHLKNYIIYCDPPYENTEQRYYNEEVQLLKFDNEDFWRWCRKMSKDNIIIVSSYSAPKDFKKIWSHGKEKLYLI